MAKKVMILPCSGIGKPAGEIGRQASYQVVRSLRPDITDIVCLARLMIDDEDAIGVVRDSMVITLDGCPDECSRKNVERMGKNVDCALHVDLLLQEHPELHPEGILNLGADGMKLVDFMADQVAAHVDRLLEECE